MKNWQKGIIVALAHVLIVLTLGGKLLYDRAHRPRVWVRTIQVDPDLPIRGRYLTLSLEILAPDYSPEAEHSSPLKGQNQAMPEYFYDDVELAVVDGQLRLANGTRVTVQRPEGERPQHQPVAPFKFVKEDMGGTNPKFVIVDAAGVKWKLKLGEEAQHRGA